MSSLFEEDQDDLVLGFDFGFRLHKLTFFPKIASAARSYSGEYTQI